MSPPPRPGHHAGPPAEYCATIVLRSPATRIDALAVIALVAESRVVGAGTVRARVPLAPGAWAEVELPRVGEPPPLAIDVYSTVGDDHARLTALGLLARLEASTAWSLRPDFAT
ncbi:MULTISPECIES: hypothetical protein [unclassified Agromyces]|uniref:hypothetical protein n=1 Tax=unclassified Agromyces TaxID=2639701 RepID=UPI0030157751